EVPIFDEIYETVADTMRQGVELRERARLALSAMIDQLAAELPSLQRSAPRKAGWPVRSGALARSGRVDAAFHDPLVAEVRQKLKALGGVRVGDVATIKQPARFKRQYTVSATHGKPMVSGAQLLQPQPVNLQLILPQSFDEAG